MEFPGSFTNLVGSKKKITQLAKNKGKIETATLRGGWFSPWRKKTPTWNPKQPFINGCFNWMIPNLYIENGCFTKHPFINGCSGFQVGKISSPIYPEQPVVLFPLLICIFLFSFFDFAVFGWVGRQIGPFFQVAGLQRSMAWHPPWN